MELENIIQLNINEPVAKLQEIINATLGTSYTYHSIQKKRRRYIEKSMSPNSIFEEVGIENNIPSEASYGWVKTDKASVFFRNKIASESYLELSESIVADMKKHSPKYPEVKRKKQGNHLLVIDPADVHIGKLSVDSETGSEYNTNIACDRVMSGIDGILQKASGFNLDEIWLIVGNDILHIDTINNTTTRGTKQDVSGTWHENFKVARKLYVSIIEKLMTIADVKVIFNPSNHDYMSGYFLADSLESWFNKSKNVTFDTSIRHRKYSVYGSNLIMTSHGDEAKETDYAYLMPNEVPKEWAETKFRYVYLHHIHHKRSIKYNSGKDFNGVTIEYLRSPSEADAWHYRNGYCMAPRAIEAFIHSKDSGQVARITNYF